MNTKAKKIVLSILISIVGTAAIALGLCYFVIIPEQTKEWMTWAWDLLNQPLPIVGVSSLVVAFFLWKIFVSSSFGKKKYNELKNKLAALVELLSQSDEERKKAEEELRKLEAKYKVLLEYTNSIKRAIPNKKVKEIAEITEDEERKEEANN